jgi:hypothetical protein
VDSSSNNNIRQVRDTHNYHLFPFLPEDVRHWLKVLTLIVEEEKSLTVSFALLSEKFVKRLLVTTQLTP